MRKQFVLSLCVLSALLILSCAKSEPDPGTNKATETKPATTSTPTSTANSSTGIGVPECDDYLAKYDACISNKVPEAARAQYKGTLEQVRSSWKQLAGNPATKASLAQACKTATEQARTAMKSFQCDF